MIPDGWTERNLEEVAQVIDCKHRTPSYSDSGIPIISPGNIHWGQINFEECKRISHGEYLALMDHCVVESGDIVVGRNQVVGVGAYVGNDTEFALGQDTILLKSRNAEPKFIYISLQSQHFRHQIHKLSGGSTFTRINLSDIRKLKIIAPTRLEQKKIAQILSTWDRAIEVVEKLIENSQTQKKALMQQLLTGKRRFPRFQNEKWRKARLHDCAECLDNKRVPLNSDERSLMQGDVPYYGANGVLDFIDKFIFDEPLVLLAEDGGYFDEFVNRPIAQLIKGKSWVNNHAHVLRARRNCTVEWIYYFLVHKNILAFINAGTRSKLNKSDMLMVPIMLPSLEEQKAICKLLTNADLQLTALRCKRETIVEEKKALMQQLLTGKRRVKIDDAMEAA